MGICLHFASQVPDFIVFCLYMWHRLRLEKRSVAYHKLVNGLMFAIFKRYSFAFRCSFQFLIAWVESGKVVLRESQPELCCLIGFLGYCFLPENFSLVRFNICLILVGDKNEEKMKG